MILIVYLFSTFIYNVSSQSTFGTLSSSGIKTNTTTISTRLTTSITTTLTSSTECPPEIKLGCKNGATCVFVQNSFVYCICTSGFTGIDCNIPLGTVTTNAPSPSLEVCPAGSSPCRNGGTCLLILDKKEYFCSCLVGYTGILCETLAIATTTISPTITSASILSQCPAQVTVCKNGGTCLIIDNKEIFCVCSQGYTSTFCDTQIGSVTTPTTTTTTSITTITTTLSGIILTPCSTSITICRNGGKCLIKNGNEVICACTALYTGEICEIPILQ